METKLIKEKFKKAYYPFINSVLRDFNSKQIHLPDDEDEFIIPPYLSETPKKKIMFKLSICPEKCNSSCKKFHEFTNNAFGTSIEWITKKIKNLFSLKDKNQHPSCQINQGTCM